MMRGCGTEPNASSKSKNVTWTVFLFVFAWFIISSRTTLCSIVPIILAERPSVLSHQYNYSLLKTWSVFLQEGDGRFLQWKM